MRTERRTIQIQLNYLPRTGIQHDESCAEQLIMQDWKRYKAFFTHNEHVQGFILSYGWNGTAHFLIGHLLAGGIDKQTQIAFWSSESDT